MMKFFRRHNKRLLAVFMAVLLVVWLAGDALRSWMSPDESKRTLASTVYGDIIQTDFQSAKNTTELLSILGFNWQRPGFAPEPLDILDWLLLEREAKRLGTEVPLASVQSMLSKAGYNEDVLDRVSIQHDITVESIYEAARRQALVNKAIGDVMSSAMVSEAELRAAGHNQLEKAAIQAIVLKVAPFLDETQTFTDAELQAHFEKYRDQDRGSGLDFGYRIPPRVGVEYFKIDLATVAANLTVGEQTLEARAKKFWQENKTNPAFRRPPKPETQPAEEPPASKPAESPNFETYDEARSAALEAVRKEYAAKAAREVATTLLGSLLEPWSLVETPREGYKPAPAEVKEPGYGQNVLGKLPGTIKHKDAVSIVTTELFEAAKATQVVDIGAAKTAGQPGTPQPTFKNLVFNVEGLVEIPTDPKTDRSQYLSLYQPYAMPLEDSKGNLYVFRVVEAQPAAAPKSLDEVRDKVIADLRLQRAYEEVKRRAESLTDAARRDGLETAWSQAAELHEKLPEVKLLTPPPFPRESTMGGMSAGMPIKGYVSGIGLMDESFMDQVFGLAEKSGDGPKVAAVEVSQGAPMIVVVQWLRTEPARQEDYQKKRADLARQIQMERQRKVAQDWLSPEKIRQRAGFKPSRG